MKNIGRSNKTGFLLFCLFVALIWSFRPLASYAAEAVGEAEIVMGSESSGATETVMESESTGEPDSARESLTVGVPGNRCPIFYRDAQSGEIIGIGVDLLQSAVEETGYDVEFKFIKEATLKDALDNEEYDLLMPFGSDISSDKGSLSVVSDNLIQTPFTLVTCESTPLTLSSMNQLRVGILYSQKGVAETVGQLYPNVEILLYDSMDDCVKALREGKVDALLNNSYIWSYVLQKPSYTDLILQPSVIISMDFRVGTLDTARGRALIEDLNKGIATLTDTKRQAIVLDHTTRPLYQYDLSDYIYQYGIVILLILLLIISLILLVLQRQKALRLEQEEKMRKLIDNDLLTGVLSMNGFRKRAEELIRTSKEKDYGIAYTNFKDFKYINDMYGRQSGDEVLRFWADQYKKILAEDEAIGRLEGDHFVLLKRMDADEKMDRIIKGVFEPTRNYFIDRGRETRLQICSGIYILVPEDYHNINVDHFLDFARAVERRVSENQRDGYDFYNIQEWEKGRKTADIISHLPVAIQSGEIEVWYQPQVNYTTRDITGMEALCRWNHSKLGWLSPGEFIPILEENNLIYELDSFIWERVCQDLQKWNEQGIHRSVSVNLSRSDIHPDRNIPGHFYQLTKDYGLTTDQLRIEITESAFVENPEELIETIARLREFGFQVEMDDFGSGYSSLHMLKDVPLDRIKLDLHFLSGSGDPEKGRIIINHIIQMVHSLGMRIIAEGVENLSQARLLFGNDCTEMQGYYFYKPMSVDTFEKMGN